MKILVWNLFTYSITFADSLLVHNWWASEWLQKVFIDVVCFFLYIHKTLVQVTDCVLKLLLLLLILLPRIRLLIPPLLPLPLSLPLPTTRHPLLLPDNRSLHGRVLFEYTNIQQYHWFPFVAIRFFISFDWEVNVPEGKFTNIFKRLELDARSRHYHLCDADASPNRGCVN